MCTLFSFQTFKAGYVLSVVLIYEGRTVICFLKCLVESHLEIKQHLLILILKTSTKTIKNTFIFFCIIKTKDSR